MTTASDQNLTIPPLNSFTWIQGSPLDLAKYKYKLCLMIQPNCPGCHQHALPVINQLQKRQEEIQTDLFILCTAFEDFEYNTLESARKMIVDQELVGTPRHELGTSSTTKFYEKLTLPVAHDTVVASEQASSLLRTIALESLKAHMTQELIHQHGVPSTQVPYFLSQVTESMLPPKIAQAFAQVQARGTPTWILYNEKDQVLDQHLGPASAGDLVEWTRIILQAQS